jgi:hypothetical protein
MVDQGLSQLSNTFIYAAMVAYTIAFVAFAIDLSGRGRAALPAQEPVSVPVAVGGGTAGDRPSDPGPGSPASTGPAPERRRAVGIALSLTYLAFGLHLAGVVFRGLSVDRAPWGNMYEFSISGTVVVTGVFLLVLLRQDLRFLGTFVIGPVL